ncbi:hypothetical protein SDC9_117648 [bioreactor metagenome]|uniref:Uncharacterized protein n=1 Tax=bioreactor metagenome TaxID=1076179 RepID=A0A645C196_9ZZZZ
MCGIPCKMPRRIGNIHHGGTAGDNAAADIYVGQLVRALCQSLIQRVDSTHAPAVINPVSGFDDFDSLVRSLQFLFVCLLIAHEKFLPVFQ